jgi:hypothetical protein
MNHRQGSAFKLLVRSLGKVIKLRVHIMEHAFRAERNEPWTTLL